MQSERHTGMVIWFDAKLGFGFIERPDEKDLFVYWSAIDPESCKGYRFLKKGQEVSYNIGLNRYSKPIAIDVIITKDVEDDKQ